MKENESQRDVVINARTHDDKTRNCVSVCFLPASMTERRGRKVSEIKEAGENAMKQVIDIGLFKEKRPCSEHCCFGTKKKEEKIQVVNGTKANGSIRWIGSKKPQNDFRTRKKRQLPKR
jgi:hypothetical protein